MKKFNALISLCIVSGTLAGQSCPPADTTAIIPVQNLWNIPVQNSWSGLEIMTWNIENFPLSDLTEDYAQEILSDLLPDVVVVQEVSSNETFDNLALALPAYEFRRTDYIGDGGFTHLDLGLAVRSDCVEILSQNLLFLEHEWEFAYRFPLMVDLRWNCGEAVTEFRLINVHFKCCNDGFDRRVVASEILRDYIHGLINTGIQTRIVVAGDFNDDIDDPEQDNSLWPLVSDTETLYFVTTPIVGDYAQQSYPWYPASFLDHILVSIGFFADVPNGDALTIRLDDYLGSTTYQDHVSDHRPVLWRLPVDMGAVPTGLVINEIMNNPTAVSDTYGEWFELVNTGGESIDLNGLILRDWSTDHHVIAEPGGLVIDPGAYMVLGRFADSELNGGVDLDYEYGNFNLSNTWDELIIQHPSGEIIDAVHYDNGETFPDPSGASMMLISLELDNSLGENWVVSGDPFGAGDLGTPGEVNDIAVVCTPNGDVNQDLLVDVIDVVATVGYIMSTVTFDDMQICLADRNIDGMVDVIDIVQTVGDILAGG